MANKTITKKYVTGKGTLTGFISVFKPSTKFNEKGVYQANILLPKEEGEKLAALIKDVRTEQYKTYGAKTKVADMTRCVPYTTVNEETGEEIADKQGRYILKTTATAYIENGVAKFKPMVVNAKKQPVKNVAIGEGTTARLGVTLSGYSVAGKTGVSVKLGLVQIIDLVEYSNNSFNLDDIDEEEGFEGVGEEFTEEHTDSEGTTEVADEEEDF